MMVNSAVPRYSNLASELHRKYLFKFKLVMFSVRSNTMMASLCERITEFNSSSEYGEIVRLQSALNDDYHIVSGKKKTYHISELIIRFFPKLVPLRSLSSSFIDSFSFAMKRCNTSQGFGAFFAQSCDRFLFPFYLFYLFYRFFPFFLDFFKVVKLLIKQLFYSGLLDMK